MTQRPRSHSESGDADLLLAVRYLMNECDADENAHFECRLADDLAAQEALVEATRIVTLLQATPACPLSSVHHPELQGTSFWKSATLLAAGLLVALTLSWQLLSAPKTTRVASVEPAELGPLWIDLDPDQIVAEMGSTPDSPDAGNEESGSLPQDTEPSEDVPDWMLSAVLVEQESSAPGEL